MSSTLDQIVARLEDPEIPVVWLDPVTLDAHWSELPDALAKRGFAVLNLDGASPIMGHDSLLERFSDLVPPGPPPTLTSLKDRLLELPRQTSRGWVVMFSHPELLRQNAEESFEDLLEVLESVHESQYELHRLLFKLVVRD